MNAKKIISVTFFLLAGTAFLQCAAPALVDVFYIDKNVLQYYLHASSFSNGTEKADIDFTFRTRKENPVAVCNFSVANIAKGFALPTAAGFVINGAANVMLDSIFVLYVDAEHSLTRYSSKMTASGLRTLVNARNVSFVIDYAGVRHSLAPEKEFYKKMETARQDINFGD